MPKPFAFGRNTQFIWNFEKIFESFQKNLLGKLQKCIVLSYYSKILTNHALIFRRFYEKR